MEKRDDELSIMNNEVAIFKDANGSLTVYPDYVFLKRKKNKPEKQVPIIFYAVNTDVLVITSEPGLKVVEKEREIHGQYIEIKAGEKKKIKLSKPEAVSAGEYPYIVFSPETNELRKGSSPPSMIIIDDP